MKYLVNPPQVGDTYRVEHNNEMLYDAQIMEHDGGCWATVKVEKILPSSKEKMYKEGQVFDLKLSHYSLYDLEESDIKE